MEATLLRSEAIKIIDSGEPFDMEFVTADRRRGTGGDLITVSGWCKKSAETIKDIKPGHIPVKKGPAKRNTFKTVRIYNPTNSDTHPITVHYKLIQFLNGKRILNG